MDLAFENEADIKTFAKKQKATKSESKRMAIQVRGKLKKFSKLNKEK